MTDKILHVGCLPFPTFQGTQAAIASMLNAERNAGLQSELLVYAHGAVSAEQHPTFVRRLADFPRVRSERSGPSFGKLALDAQMPWAIRKQYKQLQPSYVVAHHIEAALATRLSRVRPWIYFAHTALGTELETYFPSSLSAASRMLGQAFDQQSIHKADAVIAISPLLAEHLSRQYERDVAYAPTPWSVPNANHVSKSEARTALDIAQDAQLVLYAGNLDAYQGFQCLLQALAKSAQQMPALKLLIATQSAQEDLKKIARLEGVEERLLFTTLDSETHRTHVHAAADLTVIPRSCPGGLPIKLLDAMARSLPVITTQFGAAGLPIADFVKIVANDDASSLSQAIVFAFQDLHTAQTRAQHGIEYIRDAHSAARYLEAMQKIVLSAQRHACEGESRLS